MPFPPLKGHDALQERFRRALAVGRLPSTFLFVGPPGIGKRTFAIRLAAALLCRRGESAALLDPCGECPDCRLVAAGSHPDLDQVTRPADKNFIPIELLIGDREHRGREGLCHRLALKPARGQRKVAIIDDADSLNMEGANCLLKTLEEPPPGSVLILIVTSLSRQLPTIRSRCQIVRFRPLSKEHVVELLLEQRVCDDRTAAEFLAEASGGSMTAAVSRAEGGHAEFRSQLLQTLNEGTFDSVALAATLTRHVNEAGQDTSLRRQCFRQALNTAIDYYRHLMFRHCDAGARDVWPCDDMPNLSLGAWPGGPEAAAACLEYCLETELRLDSNANLSTLLECWSDDLAGIALGRASFGNS